MTTHRTQSPLKGNTPRYKNATNFCGWLPDFSRCAVYEFRTTSMAYVYRECWSLTLTCTRGVGLSLRRPKAVLCHT